MEHLKFMTQCYIHYKRRFTFPQIKAPVQKNEKEKMNFVVEQYIKHTNGELSTVDFVRSVGYKYAARTDI
jgi:hypothetical protein